MMPEKIGRYQILGELGRGAMGCVYRAFDPNIGRHVAIKTIPLDPNNPELVWRFRREAQAAGILSHPNIVTIYDAGADGNVLYIAMELVEGETLQQILTRGPVPLEQVLSFAEQIGGALDHAHSHEIIHRDIKPANVIVRQGQAKVTDFGVAKLNAAGMTTTGQVLGTPSYLAPEVVKGEVADRRSDIFSFGVVLYEMLTGKRPFAGDNISTVIYRILSEPPQPPATVNSSLPPGLNYVIQKALAKDAAQRYQSSAELVADLKNYPALAEERMEAAPAKGAANISPASSSTDTVRLDRTKLEPKPAAEESPSQPAVSSVLRRKPAWVAAAAVAAIALVASIVWQARQRGEPTSPAAGQPAVSSTPPAATPSTRSSRASAPVPRSGAMGRVVIHTQPEGARILINGQPTQYRSPVNFALAAGRYEITAERDGFANETREVAVPQNQSVEVSIEMQRR